MLTTRRSRNIVENTDAYYRSMRSRSALSLMASSQRLGLGSKLPSVPETLRRDQRPGPPENDQQGSYLGRVIAPSAPYGVEGPWADPLVSVTVAIRASDGSDVRLFEATVSVAA